ncbi:hypothetical protein WIS52_21170 [Pseudonocardia nematodicida]|uniref:Uncharacterized protein n=1 Tax=Pseudonocardia nematodicida TaxID=1206997 RepID=A0ABV1KEU1_9PSEU
MQIEDDDRIGGTDGWAVKGVLLSASHGYGYSDVPGERFASECTVTLSTGPQGHTKVSFMVPGSTLIAVFDPDGR